MSKSFVFANKSNKSNILSFLQILISSAHTLARLDGDKELCHKLNPLLAQKYATDARSLQLYECIDIFIRIGIPAAAAESFVATLQADLATQTCTIVSFELNNS